jgi:hypothetical protein
MRLRYLRSRARAIDDVIATAANRSVFTHKCKDFSASRKANWLSVGYACGTLIDYRSTQNQ